MNETPSAERVHIGFFGTRNAGKSSVVNAVTGQDLSVVSPIKGTTTDPVYKAMELLPLGPVVIMDTPGMDDEGDLGSLRVRKARQSLNRADLALLVADVTAGLSPADSALVEVFKEKKIPYLIVWNKADLLPRVPESKAGEIYVSAKTGQGIETLKNTIGTMMPKDERRPLLGDLISAGDVVLLVTPIDESAPKGRMILPQQQAIRDVLDHDAAVMTVQPARLRDALSMLDRPPRLVVTDSQAFAEVSRTVPPEIPLTSFSILFARRSGLLEEAVKGARALKQLPDGAGILISEACTHHRQCNDIGRVKLPRMIRQFTGKDFTFSFSSGRDFPEDLSQFGLVIHCGGCMVTPRELLYRQKTAVDAGIPITNYGVLIAYILGILDRSIAMFESL